MLQELTQNYGTIFEKELLLEIEEVSSIKEVPENFQMIAIGQYITSMPLLLNGAIKILRNDNDGGELLLYFLEKGDTCAMTFSCCLGNAKSEVKAITETPCTIIMIPIHKMEEWMVKYKSWRNFILDSYHNRLQEMLTTIDSIAFLKMDERLLKYLINKAQINNSNLIKNTHQEIAYELHTSRVVISRLLKKLEQKNIILLHRNSITLLKTAL